MEARASISELIKRGGHKPILPGVRGHVLATLRDIDSGRIKQQVSQDNLITGAYYQWLMNGDQSLTPLYIVIANMTDDPDFRDQVSWSTFQNTESASIARTLDYANKVYTYTTTFVGVTSPGRTVSWVGLTQDDVRVSYTYCKTHWQVFANVKLNSSIYQTPTDSLEIVYRLSFVRI